MLCGVAVFRNFMEDYKIEVFAARVISSDGEPPVINPLIRPKMNYIKPVLAIIGLFALFFLLFFTTDFLIDLAENNFLSEHKTLFRWIFSLAISFVYCVLLTKKTLIWLIHLYQHFAPDAIRLKCVFEPSCSVYMVMCIEHFGVIKGVPKGIKRLIRCHPPNKGKDYPF